MVHTHTLDAGLLHRAQVFAFFPESYILPTEYLTLVRACEAHPPDEQPVWIVKPTDSSRAACSNSVAA